MKSRHGLILGCYASHQLYRVFRLQCDARFQVNVVLQPGTSLLAIQNAESILITWPSRCS